MKSSQVFLLKPDLLHTDGPPSTMDDVFRTPGWRFKRESLEYIQDCWQERYRMTPTALRKRWQTVVSWFWNPNVVCSLLQAIKLLSLIMFVTLDLHAYLLYVLC